MQEDARSQDLAHLLGAHLLNHDFENEGGTLAEFEPEYQKSRQKEYKKSIFSTKIVGKIFSEYRYLDRE